LVNCFFFCKLFSRGEKQKEKIGGGEEKKSEHSNEIFVTRKRNFCRLGYGGGDVIIFCTIEEEQRAASRK